MVSKMIDGVRMIDDRRPLLDDTQPHDVFSGKDDLYRLLRETREAVNILAGRVKELEMANTVGNSGMVPSVQVGKGGKKK